MSSDENKGYSNRWNKYEHEHAGLGWSQSEMSENYQAYKKNGYESPDIGNESYNNSYKYEYDYQRDSSPDYKNSYSDPWNDYRRDSSPDYENSYSDPWSDYQNNHASLGWPRSDVSEYYQGYKTNDYESPGTENENKTYDNSYDYGYNSTKKSPSEMSKKYQQYSFFPTHSNMHNRQGSCNNSPNQHFPDRSRLSASSYLTNRGGLSASSYSANRDKLSASNYPANRGGLTASNYSANRGGLTASNYPANRGELSAVSRQSRIMSSDGREASTYDYNNNNIKINQTQTQSQSQRKNHSTLTWQQFQHLYKGQGKSNKELANMYHEFKTKEKTFKWQPNYQLEFGSDGRLKMNTLAGREAMKTGLFDEQGNLRRRSDQIPWILFKSIMQQMGIDSKIASAMRNNYTGSNELNASHLKSSNYRQHIPQHESPQRRPRDADHILEPQVCVPHLRQAKMDNYNFQILIEELNSKHNIKSMGQIENRQNKRNANLGIAINKPFLNVETLNQEKLQASQARLMARNCEARGAHQAAQTLNAIAEKCTQLNSIHQALNQIKMNSTQGKATKQSDITALIQQIITYERKYGTLEFRGGNVTQQHLDIFDRAHKQQSQQ